MIKIISQAELSHWVHVTLLQEKRVGLMPLVIVMGGDRITCCDEAVALEENGEITGEATIAPEGEEHSGTPAIVGLYVVPEHRHAGRSRIIMEAAVHRCISRGFTRVHVDIFSKWMMRTIEKLPAECRAILEIVDMTDGANMDNG